MWTKTNPSIVMILNYYSHHQSELSEALCAATNENYWFIETEPMEEERKNMGWGGIMLPSFVKQSYTSPEAKAECLKLCSDADVVIIGSAPDSFIENRMKENKLTFRYYERYFKEGRWRILDPRVVRSHYYLDYRFRNKNLYMLCAGAYTAPDCRFIHCYINKTYKWGYFPAVKAYDDLEALIESKKPHSILWTGRFIDWKHPEAPLYVAKRLIKDGYDFTLNIIGNGYLEQSIQKQITADGLNNYVHILGTMSPEEVRQYMEQSEVFLFTSDRNEGWGVVLNESMNSACAVAASGAIGSVPYLLEDGKNGLIFKDRNWNDLYEKVKFLFDHPAERKSMGRKAYDNLMDLWNAETAASRLLELIDCINTGRDLPFSHGPCSKDW